MIADTRAPETRSPSRKDFMDISGPWRLSGPQPDLGHRHKSAEFHTQASRPGVEEPPPARRLNSSIHPRRTDSIQSPQQGCAEGLGWIFPVPPDDVCDGAPSIHPPVEGEAERLLADYREYMEPLFPFVVIPRAMSADQLRKEKPFLWKAVMMQALYTDPSRQVPLGNELLGEIVTACFLGPRKCFDLLQALEVLIAW